MKWLAKIILAILINAVAIWACATYIPGFKLEDGFEKILGIALILTALNFLLKPLLKLVLGPIIVLTLGFGIIIVNAIILYILDILSKNLTIENIPALALSTILISLINFVFHWATK